MEQIIDRLKEKSNLTENMKNIDMLYWVGIMNSIKAKVKEFVFSEIIYYIRIFYRKAKQIFVIILKK